MQLLRHVPLFAGTDEQHLQVLAFSAGRETVRAGERLFAAGEILPAGFLVLKGEARARAEGDEEAALLLQPGDFVGEVSMIAGTAHHLTVEALSDMEVLRIPRDLFLRVCGEFPEFGKKVMANFAEHHMHLVRHDLQLLHERLSRAPGVAEAVRKKDAS